MPSYLIDNAAALGIPNVAHEIQKDLDDKKELIFKLLTHITIENEEPVMPKTTGGPLAGQVFCLTGKFSVQKDEYHRQIVAKGGSFETDFRSNVTTVVTADPDRLTGKLKKAQEKGIPILDEDGLKALLQ